MKKIVCLILCVLMALTAVACGRKTNNGVTIDSDGNVTGSITIWGGSVPFMTNSELGAQQGANYDPDCDTTQKLLAMIKAKYPKLNVNIEQKGTSTELNTALRNAKISNQMPDIVVGEQFIKSQIELGYFVPLEVPTEIKSSIPEVFWQQSQGADGKQYGYPAFTGCFALVYNKKIFREVYSLDADADVTAYLPTSMSEIVEVAAEIKDFYNTKYGAMSLTARNMSGFYINAVSGVGSAYRNGLVMSMFGGGFQDSNGNIIVNSQANKDAFKWLTSLLPYTSTGNVATTNETDVNTNILTGNVAMTFEIAPLLAPFGGIDVSHFGVAQLPIVDGQVQTNMLVGSTSYMITKECANKAVAQDILNMMVSYDVQMEIYKTSTNRIPVRTDVQNAIISSQDTDILAKNEKLLPYILQIKTAEKLVINLPSFTTNYSNIWSTWTASIQRIYTNPSESEISTQLATIHNAMGG